MSRASERTVLHIAKATGVGGSERHLLDLLPALRELGIGAQLCLLESPAHPIDDLARRYVDRGVPVSRLRIRGSADVRLVGQLRGLVGSVDLVHTHLIHADIHGGLAVRSRRGSWPRLVTTVHSERPEDTFAARSLMRVLSRRFSRCIVISEATRAAARDRLGFRDDGQIELIHYGVRVPVPTAPSGARRGLLVHSRLAPGKRIDDVIRAFAALRDPDLTLTIIGDGEHRPVLEELVARLGVQDRVALLGYVEDPWPLLEGGAIWISLSESEGFGLALIEALGAGLAVVCSDIRAHREVAEGAAVFVPVGDVAAATSALRRLLDGPTTRKDIGVAGRARAASFAIDTMARRTAAVYDEITSADPSAS